MHKSLAEELAEFVASTSYEALPAPAIEHAKEHFLDWLGCAVAGSQYPPAQILAKYAMDLGGKKEATIASTGKCVPAALAALVHGTGSHSLEADDATYGHPSVCVMPAAFAVAESIGATGRDLVAAIVVGYEIFMRLGRVLYSGTGEATTVHELGRHPTGLVGAFAAAAAVAHLLRLPVDSIVNAFGICGSQGSGILEAVDTPAYTKAFQAGWASQAGIIAARVAALGFTGPATVLEGRMGFFRAYAEGFDQSGVAKGLGDGYLIEKTGYKPYTCCRASHPSMTAAAEIVRKHNVSIADIAEIRCEMMPHCIAVVTEPKDRIYQPIKRVDAQFSLPYSVAVLLVRGKALVNEFDEKNFKDEEILSLAQKVVGVPDPVLDQRRVREGIYPSRVTIRTRDGESFSHYAEVPIGHAKNPMSRGNIEEKFRAMVENYRTEDEISSLIGSVARLDKLKSLRSLLKIVRAGGQ